MHNLSEKIDIVHEIMKIRSNYDLTYDELSTLFDVPMEKIKNYNEKKVVFEDIKAELRFSTEVAAGPWHLIAALRSC